MRPTTRKDSWAIGEKVIKPFSDITAVRNTILLLLRETSGVIESWPCASQININNFKVK